MLLVDTGVFVSAADRNEPRHGECAALLRTRTDLVVAASVIPEAAWLIENRLGAADLRNSPLAITEIPQVSSWVVSRV